LELGSKLLMQMRGLGVVWSPDSPGSNAMKTRIEPGNPEAITKYLQVIASGKPFKLLQLFKIVLVKSHAF
jgi:hypothetical protein